MKADYERFTDYLRAETARSVTLSFAQIAAIVGDLPPTAFTWEAWWSNSPSHPLAAAWLAAGWRRPRGGPSLTGQQVTLEREVPLTREVRLADAGVGHQSPVSLSATELPEDWHDFVDGALCVTLRVQCDDTGKVCTYEPQGDYLNARALLLNRYGDGCFCRFRVPAGIHRPGVYCIVSNDRLVYIGECDDFSQRFNAGYGQISPRNCYVGGQETNCRVNQLILRCAQRGWQVDVYFKESEHRKALEAAAISTYSPPWNRRG
jgi:hypothetical protein